MTTQELAASLEAPPEDMCVTKTPSIPQTVLFKKHNSKRLRRESEGCPFPSVLYTAEGQERGAVTYAQPVARLEIRSKLIALTPKSQFPRRSTWPPNNEERTYRDSWPSTQQMLAEWQTQRVSCL